MSVITNTFSPASANPPPLRNRYRMPSRNAKSANRVTMNAFFAAAAAAGRSNQNPMSRYEPSPTSSQNTKICIRLLARTSPSIAIVNRDIYAKYRA